MLQSTAFERQSRKSYIGLLLVTLCALLAQGVLAAATDISYPESELHKDNEFPSLVKRPAFFVGSRYGRSSGNGASGGGGGGAASVGVGTSKTRRLIIVPRNDRFFLGSRYGKRSEEFLSPYEQNSLGLGAERSVDSEGGGAKANSRARTTPLMTMSCVYTGISNFFRCSNLNTDEFNNIMNRSNGGPVDSSMGSEDGNANNVNNKKK